MCVDHLEAGVIRLSCDPLSPPPPRDWWLGLVFSAGIVTDTRNGVYATRTDPSVSCPLDKTAKRTSATLNSHRLVGCGSPSWIQSPVSCKVRLRRFIQIFRCRSRFRIISSKTSHSNQLAILSVIILSRKVYFQIPGRCVQDVVEPVRERTGSLITDFRTPARGPATTHDRQLGRPVTAGQARVAE